MEPLQPPAAQPTGPARLSRLQKKVWFLSGMGVFLDGFDLFIIGVALPLIAEQFMLGGAEQGIVGAAAVLGAVLGAAALGRMADRFGRRRLFMVDLSLFVIFAVASALSWGLWSLVAFRFLLGFAVGADYPIASTYLAEFMPTRVRGRWTVGAFSFQAIGMLTGASLGVAILLSGVDQDLAWRLMLGAGAIPALVIVWLRRHVPESPEWQNHKDSGARPAPVRALFTPGVRRRTTLAVVPWFIMDILLYGVGIFTPTVLAALSFTGDGSIASRDLASTEGAAFLDIFLVVGFIIAILLVERWGRMRLQLLGFAGTTVGLAILATASLGSGSMPFVFLGFALFNLLVNVGPNSTTFLVAAEVFPTELRATGAGLAASAAKMGAVVGIILLPILTESIGIPATMYIVSGVSLIGFVVTAIFRVETAGRTLDEINTMPYPVPRPHGDSGQG